jgi:hypothetical protein
LRVISVRPLALSQRRLCPSSRLPALQPDAARHAGRQAFALLRRIGRAAGTGNNRSHVDLAVDGIIERHGQPVIA